MTGGPIVRIQVRSWDDPQVRVLREAQQEEIQQIYRDAGRVDRESGMVPSAADVTVTILLTGPGGEPLACGALRQLDAHSGEVKRMYVVPQARGRGLGRAVLADLEHRAVARGWTVLRLETGDLLDDAMTLYTRAGFAHIEPYGHYIGEPNSVCFQKLIGPTEGPPDDARPTTARST